LAQADPATGQRWADRYGVAFGKGLKHHGNIEPYLSYNKLHRTGKLLRNVKVKVVDGNVVASNRVKYAKDHNEGVSGSKRAAIKEPYIRSGARVVFTGGNITARPFMNPSKKVLKMPATLLRKKLRLNGWL